MLAAAYLLGVRRLHARGDRWPVGRTVCWVLGCVVLLLATSSGLGRFAPAVFSVHMGAVAGLAIIAPLLLALGAPLTLWSAAARRGADGVPGMWEFSRQLYLSAPLRLLTRPAVALTLLFGGFYVFYLGGIYGSLDGSHTWHVVSNGYFLVAGFVFFWVSVGPDPTPAAASTRTRLITAVAGLAAYAGFLLLVARADSVIAAEYYTMLRRGWWDDLAADQRLGAAIGAGTGAVALAFAVVLAAAAVTAPRRGRTAARR